MLSSSSESAIHRLKRCVIVACHSSLAPDSLAAVDQSNPVERTAAEFVTCNQINPALFIRWKSTSYLSRDFAFGETRKLTSAIPTFHLAWTFCPAWPESLLFPVCHCKYVHLDLLTFLVETMSR